jgi:putative oxidoreductase
MKDRALAVVRLALGGLFVYAAFTKLPDMSTFAQEMANYRLLPASAIPVLGSWTVGLELVAGTALILGIAARGAALVVSGLLVLFMSALSQALLRGIDLSCGCFGPAEVASWWTVARDGLMLAAGASILFQGPGRLLPQRRPA